MHAVKDKQHAGKIILWLRCKCLSSTTKNLRSV